MKSILIIKQGLGIGGSETLVIRMCNWLLHNECKVYLLVEDRPEELRNQISSQVKKITYNGSFLKLLSKKNAKRFTRDFQMDNIDCIYGYGPIEFIVSVRLGQLIPNAKVLIGVYHEKAYTQINGSKFLKKYTQTLFKEFPEENILFMNGPVRVSHEKILKKKFDSAKIWPLPLNIPEYAKGHKRTNKIVSVGNLKRFKTYNMTMIDVIRELIDKGYNIQYDIYGEGYMRSEMEEKIQRLGLSEYIHIKGQVSYNDFPNVVREGFAFVGLGTAVLEAASFGVPAITCVSYSEHPISFGYVSELTEFNVGTPINDYKYKKIIDFLEELLRVNESEYETIRKRNFEFVSKNFELNNVMQQFIKHYENAAYYSKTSNIDNIMANIYCVSLLDRLKLSLIKPF